MSTQTSREIGPGLRLFGFVSGLLAVFGVAFGVGTLAGPGYVEPAPPAHSGPVAPGH